MKISEKILENINLKYPLEKLVPLDRALFIDIETTGFAAKTAYLYLIGCAYYQNGCWNTIQWMAENYSEEADIIHAFFKFAKPYSHLLHFNGNNFDLPFITQKCEMLTLSYNFNCFTGIDLYKRISPYKSFLGLPNCKQKTLEKYLGLHREDTFSGGELIGIYHDYVKTPSETSENSLLLHNLEDLAGMLNILPILSYYDLFSDKVKARKVQANYYKDMNGTTRSELLITLTLPTPLPTTISAVARNCYFKGDNNEAILRIPIFEGELKYFYANYHDYYYLPAEDFALHKSVASYVSKEHRTQANASNCYTRKASSYLPQWSLLFEPFFKFDYNSREIFFELTNEMKKNREGFNLYAHHILNMIATSY